MGKIGRGDMPKLLILLVILMGCALTACGPATEFCENNYDKLNGFCYTLVGYEPENSSSSNNSPVPSIPIEDEKEEPEIVRPPEVVPPYTPPIKPDEPDESDDKKPRCYYNKCNKSKKSKKCRLVVRQCPM